MNTRLLTSFFGFLLLFFASCSSPEEKLANGLAEATVLLTENPPQVEKAFAILEELNQSFPDNPEVIEKLAFAHSQNNDPTTAAFFYEEAARLDPERADLFLFAATIYEKNQEYASAIPLYEEYLDIMPNDLVSRQKLAELYAQTNALESSLKNWLEYFDRVGDDYTGMDAYQTGQLFQKLGNIPQAQNWYKRALEKDDSAAQPSLEGLLQISLEEKNWDNVKTIIGHVKQYYPQFSQGEVFKKGQSAWQSVEDLKKEMKKQESLPKQIAAAAETVVSEPPSAPVTNTPVVTPKPKPAKPEPKQQETVLVDSSSNVETQPTAVVTQKPYTNLDESGEILPIATEDPTAETEPLGEIVEISDEPPVTVEEVSPAQQALATRDYQQAITLYWKEIGQGKTSAQNWYGLAQSYELVGQMQQAEIALLESTRQAPEDVFYALEYLRVVYQTRTLREAFSSIERVLTRFPDHPDVLLSVARAYETIGNNPREANYYYNRFLKVAPDHAEAAKVKEKLGL